MSGLFIIYSVHSYSIGLWSDWYTDVYSSFFLEALLVVVKVDVQLVVWRTGPFLFGGHAGNVCRWL